MTLRIDRTRDQVVLHQQLLDLGHRKPLCVLRGVIVKLGNPSFALDEVLAIVEVTIVRADGTAGRTTEAPAVVTAVLVGEVPADVAPVGSAALLSPARFCQVSSKRVST